MRALLCAGVLAITGAVLFAQGGKTDPALNRLADEFAAAYSAKDAEKISSFYSDDAFIMAPNQRAVRGRREIQEYYRQGFSRSDGTLRLHPMESVAMGAHAFETGTSSLSRSPREESAGKYVVIYTKVGTAWKIKYDIFNNDAP